jgi:serine/threonine protein kinase
MNQHLSEIPEFERASLLALALAQNEFVEKSVVRKDLETWRENGDGSTFNQYLQSLDRCAEPELDAAHAIAKLQFLRDPKSVYSAATWLEQSDDTYQDATPILEKGQAAKQKVPELDAIDSRVSEPTSVEGESRFKILNPHRRGGLGEVFVAIDSQFQRQVALKRIKPMYQSKLKLRERFLVEAEITGVLEHPGIVPVYGMGSGSDGSPFYAMKLIQGQSLGDELKRYHAASEKSFQSVVFRKLVRRFISVCYTIHYAHSRGVVHRDIKPDNIMLGDFDETLVVDWGIAKDLDSGTTTDANKPSVLSASSPKSQTQAGQVMGSPGYMSSEQALGWQDVIGPQSDVFSLGATLYSILVPKLPFDGETTDEIIQNSICGDLNSPREIDSSVPGSLEAVCLKAMENKKADRYQTALELAEDLEAWLSDEPVSAWQEPISVRARRWMRKHQLMVVAGVTGLLAIAVAAIIASTLLVAANAREATAKVQAKKNFRVAQDVVDKLLVRLFEDPRFEGNALSELSVEILRETETALGKLSYENDFEPKLVLDRANTLHLLGIAATKFGESQNATKSFEQSLRLLEPLRQSSSGISNESLDLSSKVQLDYAGILFQTNRLEESLAQIDQGLKLCDTLLKDEGANPAILKRKAGYLVRKRNYLTNRRSLDEMKMNRSQFWEVIDQFLEYEEDADGADRFYLAELIVGARPLDELERARRAETRKQALTWLEHSLDINLEGEDIIAKNTTATRGRIVASAWTDDANWAKAMERGEKTSELYRELAATYPHLAEFDRNFIRARYTMLLARYNEGIRLRATGTVDVEQRSVLEDFEQMSEAMSRLERTEEVDDGLRQEYTHSIALIASELDLKQHDRAGELVELSLELLKNHFNSESSLWVPTAQEVSQTAMRYYASRKEFEKADRVLKRQLELVRTIVSEQPLDFQFHVQLFDLNFSVAALDADRSDRKDGVVKFESAMKALDEIPDSVHQANPEQILAMRARALSVIVKIHESQSRPEEMLVSRKQAAKFLFDFVGPAISSPNTITRLNAVLLPYVRSDILNSRFQSAERTIQAMLDKLSLPANLHAKLLADKTQCLAKQEKLELAEASLALSKEILPDDVGEDIQLDLAVASLVLADMIDKASSGESARIKAHDDYAKSVFKELLEKGIFEFELVRVMMRPVAELARLRSDPQFKELFELLEQEGRSHLN